MHAGRYGQQAGGMQYTAMQSCWSWQFKYSLVSFSVDNVAQEEMLGVRLGERADNQSNKRQKSVFKKEPFTSQ